MKTMRLEKSENNRPGNIYCLFHCSKVNGSKTLPDQIQMRREKHFDKKNEKQNQQDPNLHFFSISIDMALTETYKILP